MKLSPAQAALMHTLESAASSAILTFIVGLVQYLSTHALNWSDLATVFASGFVAAFGLIYKSVITSPNLQQAESDTLNEAVTEAKNLAQQALAHVENIWPALHALNTQQAATKAVQPAMVAPYKITDAPLASGGMIQPGTIAIVSGGGPEVVYTSKNASVQPANVSQVPFPPAPGTATPAFMLPQRSFSQSALMPAVPKQ